MCYYIPLQQQAPLNPNPLSILLDFSPLGISYDSAENRIYWADTYGTIHRAFLTNAPNQVSQVVIRGMSRPMGVEIDPIGKNIYIADQNNNNIKVLRVDGSYESVIVEIGSPQGIALDSTSG